MGLVPGFLGSRGARSVPGLAAVVPGCAVPVPAVPGRVGHRADRNEVSESPPPLLQRFRQRARVVGSAAPDREPEFRRGRRGLARRSSPEARMTSSAIEA